MISRFFCRNPDLSSPTRIRLSFDRTLVRRDVDFTHTASTLLADPHPQVVLRHINTGETELVHARYVVGADGAHSWVRKTLGIVLDGEQTNYTWGVVDCVPDTDFPDIRNQCMIHTQYGSILVIPREGDLVRIRQSHRRVLTYTMSGRQVRLYVQMDKEALELDEAGDFDRTKMSPEKLLEV